MTHSYPWLFSWDILKSNRQQSVISWYDIPMIKHGRLGTPPRSRSRSVSWAPQTRCVSPWKSSSMILTGHRWSGHILDTDMDIYTCITMGGRLGILKFDHHCLSQSTSCASKHWKKMEKGQAVVPYVCMATGLQKNRKRIWSQIETGIECIVCALYILRFQQLQSSN